MADYSELSLAALKAALSVDKWVVMKEETTAVSLEVTMVVLMVDGSAAKKASSLAVVWAVG